MNELEAITELKNLIRGEGLERDKYLDFLPRGSIAIKLWDDPKFVLGLEYGAMIMLIKAFNIIKKDIDN